MTVGALLLVLVLFVRWRVVHSKRRRLELASTQSTLQPMTEFSARFAPRPRSVSIRRKSRLGGF